MRSFSALMADRSAPVQRSKAWARLAMNSSTAIQTLATSTSTATNWPNRVASTLKTSFIAAWLAPPPIQEPATVVMPRQVSVDQAYGLERDHRAQHHADGAGQEHDDGLGPQTHQGA